MHAARPFPLVPAGTGRRTWARSTASLTGGDAVAVGLCALYGLAIIGLGRVLPDFSLRVYDFLHHAELARGLYDGRVEVDGFYPLGYPALLAAGFRIWPDLFVVGKVISGLAAVGTLFVTYRLLRALLVDDAGAILPFAAIGVVGCSPTFLQLATTPSTDMPHVALLLASLWLVLEGLDAAEPAGWLMAAGLAGGLSYLMRYPSTLALVALGLWLLVARPWGRGSLRVGAHYLLGFVVGAAPQLIVSILAHGSPFYTATLAKNVWVGNYAGPLPELRWGQVPDNVSLVAVIGLDPGHFLLNWGLNIVRAVVGDDLATIASWCNRAATGTGAFALSGPDGLAGLAPAILKLVAVIGAAVVLARGRDWTPDLGLKAGLLALFGLTFTGATALAFVSERLLLIGVPILAVLALATLHHLVSGRAAVLCTAVVVLALGYHLAAFGYPDRLMLGYGHAADASALLRARGATPGGVYATSWGFYDYGSPWVEHYEPLPIDIASVDALVTAMRTRGVRYLIYDRNSGEAQWPQLAALQHPETSPGGLRPVAPPIVSRERPANQVFVYELP